MTLLSIPTWMIHIASVTEWIIAIWLVWTYAEVSNKHYWKLLSFAMLPALASASCACIWHFFDNSSSLGWLVTIQATLTLLGNITLCLAGRHIYLNSTYETTTKVDTKLNKVS